MMASELGSAIVFSCLAGYFAGDYADSRLSSAPYGVVVGIMAGLTLGLAFVVKRSNQLEARAKAARQEQLNKSESDQDRT